MNWVSMVLLYLLTLPAALAQSTLPASADPSGLFALPAWHGRVIDARNAMSDDPRFFEQGNPDDAVYAFGSGRSGLIVNINFGRVSSLSWLNLPGKNTAYENLTPFGLQMDGTSKDHQQIIKLDGNWVDQQKTEATSSFAISYFWKNNSQLRLDLNYAMPGERLSAITLSYNGNFEGLRSLWSLKELNLNEAIYSFYSGGQRGFGAFFYDPNPDGINAKDSTAFQTTDFAWLKLEKNGILRAGFPADYAVDFQALRDSLTAVLPPVYKVSLPEVDCGTKDCIPLIARAESKMSTQSSTLPLLYLIQHPNGSMELMVEPVIEP